jgi:signal transduction histidine kinase
MRRLSAFLTSMAGRIFLILFAGAILSASLAWVGLDTQRQAELRRLELARFADRVEDTVGRWRREGRLEPADYRFRGLRTAPAAADGPVDAELTQQLQAVLPGTDVQARKLDPAQCLSPQAGAAAPLPRRCWLLTVNEAGATLHLLGAAPPRPNFRSPLFEPVYLIVLLAGLGALALIVARMAAAPLRALSRAATELGDDLTRRPLPLTGPSELRLAATAFNSMQTRLQRQLAERMHMLAAITHDLQTPMTRLRLRLEKVADPQLQERLLADVAAMQALIKEGLDLARSANHAEERRTLDLQSLVDSIADDAADAGQPVMLGSRCQVDVSVQPEAIRRCIANLIDNALKYGGAAEVSVSADDGAPVVTVRDRGPGVATDELDRLFEPFFRAEESRSRSTGGVGLGLTIARTLAEKNGATILLRNHPAGGIEASVRFSAHDRA